MNKEVKEFEKLLKPVNPERLDEYGLMIFKGINVLLDYINQLESTLNEVKDRIQFDIEENEELYADTPFIIKHENMDLYDYLKILNKVGGSNE